MFLFFQAKVVVVIRISQPLIDIQIPLTGFYRQKITAFRYWMHDDFLRPLQKNPMSIEFHAISSPKYWLQMIAEQLSTTVINDEVHLPVMFGQGVFKQYYPCEWLTISYSKIKVYEPMHIHRLGRRNTNLIPIVFYIDKFEQLIGDEKFSVGKTERNGIYMHSPEIDTK